MISALACTVIDRIGLNNGWIEQLIGCLISSPVRTAIIQLSEFMNWMGGGGGGGMGKR